ncbi:Exosome complex component RRP41 [Homalodisca vitripennis]|nr:Exosome complex component RRP41 [Homalodisca vitripennis]
MATFSTGERKRRPRGDRKSQEMTMHLRQALTAAIRTELYPRSQIDIFLEGRFHRIWNCLLGPIINYEVRGPLLEGLKVTLPGAVGSRAASFEERSKISVHGSIQCLHPKTDDGDVQDKNHLAIHSKSNK